MHPLTDVEEIKTAIENEGHKVINIWNVKNRATKQPLPMFFIDLKPSPDNKAMYAIKHLLHCRIVFEAPRPKFLNMLTAKGMDTSNSIATENPDV